MPKPMYVWSGSAWVSVASEVESLANFATQSYADNIPGMKLIVPTSVAVGSGSGSVGTSGAVTFSGASSVSLNDVFNSTYDNYRIVYNPDNTSNAGSTVTMRLRVAGADNSSSNYNYSFFYQGPATANTVSNNRENNATGSPTTSWYFLRDDSDGGTSYTQVTVFNPFVSKKSSYLGETIFSDNTSSLYHGLLAGQMTVTTSYTGFTLISSSGNIGGTIRVYGMKN